MYPKNITELSAILAAAVPLLIWATSGAFSVHTKLGANRRADWLRINELIQILYKGVDYGLWAQMLAATELASFKKQRAALIPIMKSAVIYFSEYPTETSTQLSQHIVKTFDIAEEG